MLKRWQPTFAAVTKTRAAKILFALWGLIAFWDTFGSQLTPPAVREKWPTVYDIAVKTNGYLPFWVWIVIGALIFMGLTLEYAHRKQSVPSSGGNTFFSPTVSQNPPTPEQEARRLLVAQRSALERAALNTKGTPLVYEFDNSGIGRIELAVGNKHYALQISKCSATAIWVYANNNSVKWASIVKTIKPYERIDVRTLRRLRDPAPVEIGQRAFFEMDDGTILQLVVVGALFYNSGDDKDEVRIKYRMYDPGEFLIEPL